MISSTARRRDAVEVVEPDLALVGMVGERQHPVADRVPGRLVAGDDEQHEERAELLGREAVPVDLGLRDLRRDVVARVRHPVGAELLRVGPQLVRRRERRRDVAAVLGVARAEHDVRLVEDLAVLGLRDRPSCRR